MMLSFDRLRPALPIVALFAFACPALSQRTPPSEWKWIDANVAEGCRHATLFSPSMNREIGYSVFLPPSYESTTDRRYPVVYYLHGASGSESSSREFAWAVKQGIANGAIDEAIYVFPNGGHYGGYRDWEDRSVMAETWIIKELIPHIDATYRTIDHRDGRALCGWSMGGGGSLRFLMKYPEMFCAAATMSAAVTMRGGSADDSAVANLTRNADQIRNRVGIWMAVGSEDRLREGNESFSAALKEANIDHTLTLLPDTGHNLGQMSAKFHRDIVLMLDRHLTAKHDDEDSEEPIKIVRDVPYIQDADTSYERERCKLDWYLPNGKQDFATIVWFHGGGLRNGDKAGEIAASIGRRFAADGVAVASVNYRLSPKVKYPSYVQDAAAAVAFVQDHVAEQGGSPKRIFVSGHSAGGYLTSMVGLHREIQKQHGIGRNDVAGYIPVSGQMVTHSTVRGERDIPRTQPIIDEAAPAYHVANDTAPFLCIAGGRDLPARSEENRYFVAAMKAAGNETTEFREFPDRDHSSIANQLGQQGDAVAAAILQFIGEPTQQVASPETP